MNESAIHAIHVYVSGRVQGVFFRQSAYEKAKVLSLTGWVRNVSDGRVELVACGDERELKALVQWLWKGPPLAKVSEVKVEEAPIPEVNQFEIRY